MAKGGGASTPKSQAELREERLKAALKANMARRKAQARARAAESKTTKASEGPTEESR
ncbi:hypothetical protein AB2B41_18630 [Marimonas sp. MJW-29]|uniref:Transcriptional regulator n=1 Tax=Sulfitobacter sediminis TaxID=3234186 RepID=A0ABV3RRN6_9RHOB